MTFNNLSGVRLPMLQLTTSHSQCLNSGKSLGTGDCGQSQRGQTGCSLTIL